MGGKCGLPRHDLAYKVNPLRTLGARKDKPGRGVANGIGCETLRKRTDAWFVYTCFLPFTAAWKPDETSHPYENRNRDATMVPRRRQPLEALLRQS